MKTFTEKVYEIVKKIPRGEVLTYKEVAKKARNLKASRAVGNILNKNNDIIVIQKNNIKLEQLFNAKICSYKYQISIIFKTFLK